MEIPSPDDIRSRFGAALQEHNFGKRCNFLASLGRELQASGMQPERLEAMLDSLVGEPAGEGPAFAEQARLIVAKSAACLGYSKKVLDHPSHSVRFAAVRGGLLSPADAREAFLASNSSRKLKQLLVGYRLLPVDEQVLDHAWQLFGPRDKELVWKLLVRVTDEQLLKSWLFGGCEEMTEWLGDRMNSCRPAEPPPGLPQLAMKFPRTMVELVRQGTLRWSWYWTKDILQTDPALVLRAAFLEGHLRGIGPRKGYIPGGDRQTISETLASWGWRHQPDLMLEICREHTEKSAYSKVKHGESMDSGLVQNMAEWLMEVTSTRYYLTTGQKLKHLMSIWSHIPLAEKTGNLAHTFVELLPAGLHQNRTKDLQQLVDAFWKIVSEVGRATRKEILVGKEAESEPCCTHFLKTFLKKLPAPLAVEHFFRILEEFEADSPAYEFVQSEVCCSSDGRYDGLMQRVFGRYLQKDGLSSLQAASMFQVLLNDARLMDVIQASFDLLLQRLDDRMEIGLMEKVVLRMRDLEMQSRIRPQSTSCSHTPVATLPVPVHWVRLVQLPRNAVPHADFLLHVLNTDPTSETELMGAVLGKYGPSFFWDTLGHVLSNARPGGRQLLEQAPLPPNMDLFKQIDIQGVLKPVEQRSPGTSQLAETLSRYFAVVADTKKKTLGKDPSQRKAGYAELMSLAQKERDQSKAFEDLLPFLVGRFSGEQDVVRIDILKGLLEKKLLPFKLWEGALPHLQSLWKVCSKSREGASYYAKLWNTAGNLLVEQALRDWTDSAEPSAVCNFGVEISGGLDLPAKFVKLQKQCEEGKSLSEAAIRWIFETAVPLSNDAGIPISIFWTTLQTMAAVVPDGKGAERALWERWAFVGERWRALLAQGVKQKAIQFALIDIVEILTKRSKMLAKMSSTGELNPWWEPLECAEYKAAVSRILEQMQSGEIPAREASSMLALRVGVLVKRAQQSGGSWKVRGRKRRARVEDQNLQVLMRAQAWVANESWDIPKHHRYSPLPWDTYRCADAVARAEVAVLSKLLASGRARRQVLWQIVEVASLLSGPDVSDLVGGAIATLNARLEGMARTIARHYPYLNSALTKGEKQNGSPDVLTPLLELWLFDDSSRDACVSRIMKREDFEYFLFFGMSFARHVSNTRQEWLHLCLQKLQAPGVVNIEFYHYARRGPMLHEVAQLGSGSPGWRSTLRGNTGKKPNPSQSRRELLAMLRKGKGKGNGRRGKGREPVSINSAVLGSVQTYLWHPETQAQFLEKALCSTHKTALALIPRLAYTDSLAYSSRVLKSYPKEQTTTEVGTDIWGWEVIQAAGAYSDLPAEIERRFLELPAPWSCDAVGDPEKECIISALGRADDAVKGLDILGQFAGKVKGVVKESVTKLISQVNPMHARRLIHDLMLPRKSGVGLQVAGLRKIVELQIPDPLELYRRAWSNGKCPRDVAGIILAKVNTAQNFSPDQVRGFFDFFRQMAGQQDECIYVAGLLLDQLIESPDWSLPFLPDVVAKLAMLPGMTQKAVDALKASSSHVTEVVRALAEVIRNARMAARATPSVAKDSPEAQTLKDLKAITSFSSLRDLTRSVSLLRLESCAPMALKGFVEEVLNRWEDAARARDANKDSLLECVLAVWVKLLRPGEATTWPSVLESMEKRLARRVPGPDFTSRELARRRGHPQDLGILAQAIAAHVPRMSLGPEELEVALAAAGRFFERLLDEYLHAQDVPQQQVDSAFRAEMQERSKVANGILVKSWAGLLARGGPEVESARLFARCPDRLRLELATAIVTEAVKDTKEKKAQWRQKRPEEGWRHLHGIPVEDVRVGSKVDGVVTNSSAMHGVFLNFGCVKDGKLNAPTADWKRYHVGDEVKGMIVNKVDFGANNQFIELILMHEGGNETSHAFQPYAVAQRALAWLSSPAEQRSQHFASLAELWASVVALDQGGLSFDASLALLGTPPPPPADCVRLVLELLGHKPAKELTRQALTWLGKVSPEDAVLLWSALLTPSADKQDVEALLTLCEANGSEPPDLPQYVIRDLSDEVLGVFAASSIPLARLIVIQALGERHCSFDDLPPVLEALCNDTCEVVAVAARNLWVGLRDSTEKLKKEGERAVSEQEESESDDSEEEEEEEVEDDDASDI